MSKPAFVMIILVAVMLASGQTPKQKTRVIPTDEERQ